MLLITGGTGNLGTHVRALLDARGTPHRVLSRRPHDRPGHVLGDLADGTGVREALVGVDAVLHLAGANKGDEVLAANLVAEAGHVRHLVGVSVVGADRVPVVSAVDRMMFGYVGAQLAAEKVIAGSGIPWTVLRATQFHDLVHTMVKALAGLPVAVVPRGVRAQPVAVGEVAARLVELLDAGPSGLVEDLAGPRVYGLDELVRDYQSRTGRKRPLLRVPLPGGAARAFRDGGNLNPDRAVGVRTWEEFLDAELRRA